MIRITFTPNLARHITAPAAQLNGDTVRDVLNDYFRSNPQVRAYILDDQDALREKVLIFLDTEMIQDRTGLSDKVADNTDIFVVQALSGG